MKSWLPKKPGEVELKVIHEMFEASVDGQAYDLDKWGQYYKPYGVGRDDDAPESGGTTDNTESVATPAAATKPVEPKVDAAASTSGSGSRAEDIIALIRNRQKTA